MDLQEGNRMTKIVETWSNGDKEVTISPSNFFTPQTSRWGGTFITLPDGKIRVVPNGGTLEISAE